MTKITKKDFKALHADGKLGLVSCYKEPKESMYVILLKNRAMLPSLGYSPVSRIDLGSDKCATVSCHKVTIDFTTLYLVEYIIDSSKDSSCSWDDISKETIIYKGVK